MIHFIRKLVKKIIGTLTLVLITQTFTACNKRYEEGPTISFKKRFERITGNWKLTEMSGIQRLQPEIEQYLSIKREPSGSNFYDLEATNFQDDYNFDQAGCIGGGEALFSHNGSWSFMTVITGAGVMSGLILRG